MMLLMLLLRLNSANQDKSQGDCQASGLAKNALHTSLLVRADSRSTQMLVLCSLGVVSTKAGGAILPVVSP
jgi:hypothetical protein